MGDIREYAKTIIATSFEAWRKGFAMIALFAALASVIAFLVFNYIVEITAWGAAVISVTLFAVLLFVVSPFFVWRNQKREIDRLKGELESSKPASTIIPDQLQKDRLALADEVTRIRMMVTRGEIPADQKGSIFAETTPYTDRLDGDPIAAFLWRDFVREVQQFVAKLRDLKKAEAIGGAKGMADFVKWGTRDRIDAKASPLLRYLIDGQVTVETRAAMKNHGEG